jgi:arylsulfatase A-like enzyme/Tfp pilus assembly protein PilF
MRAREGVLFADATTQSPLTGPAHTALFTGQYPGRLGVNDNAAAPVPESALMLAEIFKGSGYETGAFIGAFILDRQYGFAQGFDEFDATFQASRPDLKQQVQRNADEVVTPAISWLKARSAASPFFAWVHLYDAHAPYAPPPPFETRFTMQPYDGEVAYMDMALGTLLTALADSGLDQTIVMAIGDHGEALGDHGEEDHGIFLYESVLRIPWIARLPNSERAGSVVNEQVRAIDLVPTVLDLAGLQGPTSIDGESVAGVMRGHARRDPPASYGETHYPRLHFGWSMLRSIREGMWKYIDAPTPELYDLRADPEERRNLAPERGAIAASMASELHQTERSLGPPVASANPPPDPGTLARLRSLGYVGVAAPSAEKGRGADPKDKIEDYKLFRTLLSRAMDDITAVRSDAAIEKLRRAAAINERSYDLHVLLGDAWRQKGQLERAIGEYDVAALLNPNIAAPHVLAAETYLTQGRFNPAFDRLEMAHRLEPESREVAMVRGRAFERSGRGEDALAEYQRALTLGGLDVGPRARLANVAMNLRRFDIAEPQLRQLLELNYQPARTHHALGHIAEARGDPAAAEAEYRRALALDPGLEQARQALARITRQ